MDRDAAIEFFFDIGSPYSYLASTQMPELERETGLQVVWRPFLLGGVFKATGNAPPARVQAKAQYMLQDLNRWADHYEIPFQMSPHFPVNSLLAQRALQAVRARDPEGTAPLARELFRRYWVDGEDVSEEDVVVDAADGAGFDGATIVERTKDQEIKDRLHETTDEAVERGAFGAPTIFVDDRMFWGNDRLHFVREVAEEIGDER